MRAAEWLGGRVPVEDLNDARTPLAVFFSILRDQAPRCRRACFAACCSASFLLRPDPMPTVFP